MKRTDMHSSIFIFLAQALFIIVLPPLLANCFRLGALVPLVVVQIVFGVFLGPSGLGKLAPTTYSAFFPPESLGFLSHVSSLALFFFAILTGMHLDTSSLKGHGRKLGVISIASMLVPLGLGTLAGYAVSASNPQALAGRRSDLEFAVSIGMCCSVTALPVLAAMLRELSLMHRRIGQLALALAAGNDGMLWILLAVFLSVIHARNSNGDGLLATSAFIVLYFAIAFIVVRPALAAWARKSGISGNAKIITTSGIAIVSAAVTEYLGLHFLLGGFIAGVIVPASWREALLEQMQPITVNILIPFFFVSTGLRVLIDVDAPGFLEITAIITASAVIGKAVGTAAAARLVGESWDFSLRLGALAQAKGLMELVVATILLDCNVISSTVFSALILMALISTALTLPLMRFISYRNAAQAPPARAADAQLNL